MNPTALTEAYRMRFPIDHIVGVWWSGSEEDVIPAKKAAVGYIAAGFHPPGTGFPIIKQIQELVHAKGKGSVKANRIGTIYHTRGVIMGMISVEAIRTAQEKYGKKPLTGEQIRWGLENLNIDSKRIQELGADGLLQPITTSCLDHEGGGAVKFQQWDGKKWNVISDWIPSDTRCSSFFLAKLAWLKNQ